MAMHLTTVTKSDDLEDALATFLLHPHSQGTSSSTTPLPQPHAYGLKDFASSSSILAAENTIQSCRELPLATDLFKVPNQTSTCDDESTVSQDASMEERVVILLGPSGSGKTSFVSLILDEGVDSCHVSSLTGTLPNHIWFRSAS